MKPQKPNNLLKQYKEAIGSRFTIEVDMNGESSEYVGFLIDDYWRKIDQFDQNFSRFKDNSELSLLNQKLGKWSEVSSLLYQLLQISLDINLKTKGYFDLGVNAVLTKQGYGLERLVKDMQSNKIDQSFLLRNNQVFLNKSLDLGGIGKGYLLGLAKTHFSPLKRFCLNAGGDLYAKGTDWKVYLENPLNLDEAIGWVMVDDLFLASSNGLKRKWNEVNHHLVNPLIGETANEMLAVYVQGNEGYLVDAYSTALYAMGYELAKEFMLEMKEFEAMLIGKNGQIWKTKNFILNLF